MNLIANEFGLSESRSAGSRQDVTAQLARKALALRREDFPADVSRIARQCFIDWFAVTLAARHDPLVEILSAEALEEGGHALASLIGREQRVGRLQAALINGAASHALDYDDVHGVLLGHPSVTLVPALLAAAQGRQVSGARLIESFVAGYETLIRVARLVNPAHYDRGFHSTGTLGSFGAAAACAHLAGLDANTTATAFGIAGTSTSGLKSMFGTMCKPMHAGLAARNGLAAVRLAARGFGSRTDVLEAEQGFASALGSFDADAAQAALADAPRGFYILENLFKYHAACYGTHGGIEATRLALGARLGAQSKPDTSGLRSVSVRASKRMQRVCAIANPQTGLEAKFSVRATIAFVLAGLDTAGIHSYSDELVRSATVRNFIERIQVDWVDQASDMLTEVTIDFDGQPRAQGRFDPGIAERDLDRQQNRIEAKFRALTTPEIGTARAEALLVALNRLDEVASIDEVIELAVQTTARS